MTSTKNQDWHDYYKNQSQELSAKKSKRKISKSDNVAMYGSLFIVALFFSIGSLGLIPSIIISISSYWVIKKIAQSFFEKK